MKIKYINLIFFLSITIVGCSSMSRSDREMYHSLVGIWAGTHAIDETYLIYGEVRYDDNGTFVDFVSHQERTSSGKYVEFARVYHKGEWRVEDSKLISFNIKSSEEGEYDQNDEIHDKIVYVGDEKAVFIDPVAGNEFERYRK